MAPKKARKKLRKEEKVKKAITIEKKRELCRHMRVPKMLRPSDPEAGPRGLQTLPRRERTPESQLLFLVGFLWEFWNAL